MAEALFLPDGDRFVPTEVARGPWTPHALHGGPPAALVARAIERCDPAPGLDVMRLTLELVRPVPTTPLSVRASITRPGRNVQLVEAVLAAGDVEVARARALRVRAKDVPIPAGVPTDRPPGPESGERQTIESDEYPGFHNIGAELRFVRGSYRLAGPATVWIRLAQPVVPGEEPSPLQRAVAAADFGNGVSAVLDWDRYLFLNPELTVYTPRQPVGEWICLDAVTYPGPDGRGLAESVLYDGQGRFGRSVQALLIDDR